MTTTNLLTGGRPFGLHLLRILFVLPSLVFYAQAAQWSETELHIQQGDLTQAFGPDAGADVDTLIFTLQHASGWEYGANFLFVDHISVDGNTEFYGEWYPFFSGQKILGLTFDGVIADAGLVLGVNAAPDSNVVKYLPGLQVNWNLPGFAFFTTLFTAYIDDSDGLDSGGAPREDDSMMIDVAWRYPFGVGEQLFSVEGHAEYITSRDTEIPGLKAKDWVLAQVQLRWDVGQSFSDAKDRLFVGIEYQYWRNKLGTDEDESAVQLLGVWRF